MTNIIISDLEKNNHNNQLIDVLPYQQELVKGGWVFAVKLVAFGIRVAIKVSK